MNLAEAISAAHQQNERTLANSIAAPKPDMSEDMLAHIRRFAEWCKSKGVPFCPAQPATVAAYIRHLVQEGPLNYYPLLAAIRAIEQMHDQAGLANPCATLAVRHELGCHLHIDAPRSWPKADRPLFNALPIEVRAVIERRADQDSKALRRLQNEAAELRKHTQKGNTDVASDKETTE